MTKDLTLASLGKILDHDMPRDAVHIAARDWSYTEYGRPVGSVGTDGCWRVQIDAILKDA